MCRLIPANTVSSRLSNIFRRSLRVMPLGTEEARMAIEKPLDRYNELHNSPRPITIEPELVDAVLRDVQTGTTLEEGWTKALGGDAPKAQIEARLAAIAKSVGN